MFHKLVTFFIAIFVFRLCSGQETKLKLFSDENVFNCFKNESSSSTLNKTISDIEDVSKILTEGFRVFSLQLFRTLTMFESKTHSKGIIFSPISIWSTLISTYLGSKGETEFELKNKLKLQNLDKSSIAMAFKGIKMWANMKNNNSKNTYLSDVNKIYISNNIKINKCFQEIFPDTIETKDFSNKPLESLKEINDWILKQTNGKIENLLPSGSITPITKVLIANAIYFKSTWAQQFDISKTKKDKFYISPTEEIEVDMMTMDSISVLYGISEELQATAVEIPYSNPDYSMVIILPDISRGLDSLVRDISIYKLQDFLSNLFDDEVKLTLPKFKAEQEFDLAGPLYSLGIKKVFDPRYVDLSNMINQENNSIALDSVVHKSFIEVNEEGTEAAAATALVFARSGRPAFPTEFIANRPFLYVIRDISTNMFLFMGTVRKPY